MSKIGADTFFELLALQRADNSAQKLDPSLRAEHNSALHQIAENILASKSCLTLSDLSLKGDDIISLGYKGREIGKALSFILDAVLKGEVENTKELLIMFLKENFR